MSRREAGQWPTHRGKRRQRPAPVDRSAARTPSGDDLAASLVERGWSSPGIVGGGRVEGWRKR